MHGTPTLRALLGPLEPLFGDSAVREVLVAGPDKVFVVRASGTDRASESLSDARIRAVAERIVRMLGPAYETDRWRGPIGFGLGAHVFGAMRGVKPPVIALHRLSVPNKSLAELIEGAEAGTLALIEEACADGLSIVVAGRRTSGKTAMVAALARQWKTKKKVALIEAAGGVLDAAEVAHMRLDPARGVRDAIELGADVIVADDADPVQLAALFSLGRPFIASIEAQDAPSAIARLIARAWTGLEMPRGAAELVVDSAVDLIVETNREEPHARVRVMELAKDKGTLLARPALAGRFAGIAGEVTPQLVPPPLSRLRGGSITPAVTAAVSPPVAAHPALSGAPSSLPHANGAPSSVPPGPAPSRVTSRAPRRATPLSVTGRSASGTSPATPPRAPSMPRDIDRTPSLAIPTVSVTSPKKDLGSLVAIPLDSSQPPVDPSGPFHGFEHSEVSEIRAEQLVSKSFVMNLNDVMPDDVDPNDIVLLDLPDADGRDLLAGDDDDGDVDKTSNGTDDPGEPFTSADALSLPLGEAEEDEGPKTSASAEALALDAFSEPEEDSLVSPLGDVDLVSDVAGALGNADIEDDELANVAASSARDPAERPKSPRRAHAPISAVGEDTLDPDDSAMVTRTDNAQELAGVEVRQVRREVAERTPTVLNQQSSIDNPLYKDAPPVSASNRDSWAQAEYQLHADDDEESLLEGGLTADVPAVTEAEPSPSGEINAAELLTGTALSYHEDEAQLRESDMDSTQSAQLGEMVASDPDFNAFATIQPDADDPAEATSSGDIASTVSHKDDLLESVKIHIPLEPTRDLPRLKLKNGNGAHIGEDQPGHFDEVTPYSPLLEKDSNPRTMSDPEILANEPPQIDPNRAAVVSGEEFDAMLDEIRDVTNASSFDNENTESAGQARPAPKTPSPARPGPGDKRRPRGLR